VLSAAQQREVVVYGGPEQRMGELDRHRRVAGAPGYETGGQERLRAPVVAVICRRFGLATQGRCVVDDRQRSERL